jgi:PadR family transcriptional regulator AphA
MAMVISKVSLRYFILGLLSQRPMSGYDIWQFIEGMSWLIGSPSWGGLYPALQALLRDGLALMEVIPGKGRPPRKIYTITDAGRTVLQEWMRKPSAPSSLKAFIMRLILASHGSLSELIGQLGQRRSEVASHQSALQRAGVQDEQTGDLGRRLALDYGLAVACAELAWLDATLQRLVQTAGMPEPGHADFALGKA